MFNSRDRILGRNWDISLKGFPLCYSQSPLLPLPLSKSGLKLVCNVNIVYGNLKSENFQDYAQKPQRNCMFMNSASVRDYRCTLVLLLLPTTSRVGNLRLAGG